MAKRILLTGVGGFIGSHCLEYFLDNTDWNIVGIDSFRHKGDHTRLSGIKNKFNNRVKILTHDLTVPISSQLENLIMSRTLDERGNILDNPIDIIINMASDSAVERSTIDPVYCLRNNYDLTINMLELARRINPKLFIQISTDEVYGEAKQGSAHKEWDTILPSNPYAASKAAQEAVAISYWRTYDIPVVLTNTMNIIAEMQDPEKFLPKIIQKIAKNEEVPIYGDSLQNIGSRIYLDAKNKADALIFISKLPVSKYSKGAERPDRYNICGDTELNNLEFAQLVAKIMGKELKYKLIPSESARKGYDRRYALDGSKLEALGWKQPILFNNSIDRIVKWTMNNHNWII